MIGATVEQLGTRPVVPPTAGIDRGSNGFRQREIDPYGHALRFKRIRGVAGALSMTTAIPSLASGAHALGQSLHSSSWKSLVLLRSKGVDRYPSFDFMSDPGRVYIQRLNETADAMRHRSRIDESQPPYVSLIWSLVEAQHLKKARALLKFVPDSPEYIRLKRLLSLPTISISERRDVDRRSEFAWLTQHAKDFSGKWVAVAGDSLVAAADTLGELRRELRRTALTIKPIIHHVE